MITILCFGSHGPFLVYLIVIFRDRLLSLDMCVMTIVIVRCGSSSQATMRAGVEPVLDAADMAAMSRPDPLSVMTYVALVCKSFGPC